MHSRQSQHTFSTFGSDSGSNSISIPRQSQERYVGSVQSRRALTTRPYAAAMWRHRDRQGRTQQRPIPMPTSSRADPSIAGESNSMQEDRHRSGRNDCPDWIAQLAGDTNDDSSFENDANGDDRCASTNNSVVVQSGNRQGGNRQRDFFYWRTQQAKIDALLAEENLERVEMPSDGNCLFHAVASFFDSFTTHRDVRHRICDYIDQNRERFEIDILHSGYASIDEYLRMMRRDREWGDAIMLNAFCLCFDINVVLFTPHGSSELYPGPTRAKMALVAFGQHYTATRVRSGARTQIRAEVSDTDPIASEQPSAEERDANF